MGKNIIFAGEKGRITHFLLISSNDGGVTSQLIRNLTKQPTATDSTLVGFYFYLFV